MAYTTHGHHIPGTLKGQGVATAIAPIHCGGVDDCPGCRTEVDEYKTSITGTGVNYPEQAMELVREYVDRMHFGNAKFDVYVVIFAYVLGGWKALISTTIEDGMYYEVTYNVNKREAYLDAYKKLDNVRIPL
jgi:hypothetical protein